MKSPNEAVLFYRSRVVAFARSLPLSEAVLFLRGALEIASTHPEMEEVRRAYEALAVGDDQLELIAGPQAKLNLEDGRDGK